MTVGYLPNMTHIDQPPPPPPPPPLVQRRSQSSLSPPPLPTMVQNGHKDYDIPITKAEREVRERISVGPIYDELEFPKDKQPSPMSGSNSRPISLTSVTSSSLSVNSSRESHKDDGDYDIPRPVGNVIPPSSSSPSSSTSRRDKY